MSVKNDLSPKEIESWSDKFEEVYGGEWEEFTFALITMVGATIFLLYLIGYWR